MNWEIYIPIILMVLLLIAGGYIRKLVKEIHEFFSVLNQAIADGDITPAEMVKIIKEAKDVKDAIISIVKAVQK